MRSRSRKNTSCVVPGNTATRFAFELLDRGDPCILLCDDRHAAIAGRGNDHDRFSGRGAEQCCGNAERAEIDRLGHDGILAFCRSFKRKHLDLVTRRHELIVEIGRDGVDQFQGTGPNDDRLLSPHDRRTGQQPGPDADTKTGNELAPTDSIFVSSAASPHSGFCGSLLGT